MTTNDASTQALFDRVVELARELKKDTWPSVVVQHDARAAFWVTRVHIGRLVDGCGDSLDASLRRLVFKLEREAGKARASDVACDLTMDEEMLLDDILRGHGTAYACDDEVCVALATRGLIARDEEKVWTVTSFGADVLFAVDIDDRVRARRIARAS